MTPVDNTDDVILKAWYQYAAQQEGFVGRFLELLRKRQRRTKKQQKADFGTSDADYLRLQGMPLPRSNQFVKDARKIAEACNLNNPALFVQEMLLARSLFRNNSAQTNSNISNAPSILQSYQAAFDEDDDLDTIPDVPKET